MKGVQCYELFGGITLKNHAFSCSYINYCTIIGLLFFFKPKLHCFLDNFNVFFTFQYFGHYTDNVCRFVNILFIMCNYR